MMSLRFQSVTVTVSIMQKINFEIIFNALSDNLLVLNQAFIVIAISEGLINYFQITRPTLIGKPVWELYALMTKDQSTPEFEAFLDSFYHAKKLKKIYTLPILQFEKTNAKGVTSTRQLIPKITPITDDNKNDFFILHLDDRTEELTLEKAVRFFEKEFTNLKR